MTSLEHALDQGRARAYLLIGPSGTGKTTLARIIANSVVGGEATAHNLIEANAADKSGADDMRAVLDRTLYRAIGLSPDKIVVIDECHRLSAAAWSVLLKPIEEPPEHVTWVLCTTEASKVPKTIQTRCLKYELTPVDEVLIYELLLDVARKEGLNVKEEIIEAAAEASSGSPRQALVNLEICATSSTAQEARAALRSAVQSDATLSLCRWLASGRNRTWAEAVRHIKALEMEEPETVRIQVTLYMTKVAMSAKDPLPVLAVLEAFSQSFHSSDKAAPLVLALATALGLGE